MNVFDSWLNQATDVDELSDATVRILQKIESLPEDKKGQVREQLKSNNKFTDLVGRYQTTHA